MSSSPQARQIPGRSPTKTLPAPCLGTSCPVTACKSCHYPERDGAVQCLACFETQLQPRAEQVGSRRKRTPTKARQPAPMGQTTSTAAATPPSGTIGQAQCNKHHEFVSKPQCQNCQDNGTVLQRVSINLSLATARVTKDGFELLERRDGTHVPQLDKIAQSCQRHRLS